MKKVKLGDVCKIQSGGTPSRGNLNYWNNGNIPWVKISDIKEKHLSRTEEFITQEGLANSSAKIFPKETILYTIFATLGEVSILEIEATTNQAIAGLQIIDENICKDYLYYYLISLKPFVNEIGRGVAQNNINMQILRNFEIPLPSLEEQKAIARKLDKVSGLIEKRKTQLEKLSELVKSRFIEMFESGNYPVCRLGDVCSKITDGTHKTPNYLDAGVTFISAKNIVNGELDFSDVKYISDQEYAEIQKRCQTEMGDILLSKSGSLGAPVIVKTTERIGLFESLAVIKYDRSKLLPAFLCEQLKSDRIQRQFKVGTKGVAIKHLHLGVIADTDIVVPPIEDQNAFATFVEQVDKSKFEIQKSLEKLEILKKSLMQKYFG